MLDPLEMMVRQEERDQMTGAIRSLPETERLVLRMVDLEGFSESDTASCAAMPMAKVRSALARARALLKARLA